MTMTMFILLATIMCTISGLLTEGIKAWYKNNKKEYSVNLIALIDAFAVGGIGTAIAYVLMGITFTLSNILCIVIMIAAVWLGSMIGYDKIIQTITQISTSKDTK